MASDNFGENDEEDPDHKGQVFISPIHETARETLVPCVKMTLLMMRAMDITVILHIHIHKCLKNPKCRPRSPKLECSSVS